MKGVWQLRGEGGELEGVAELWICDLLTEQYHGE
jgi:hypothetical protein